MGGAWDLAANDVPPQASFSDPSSPAPDCRPTLHRYNHRTSGTSDTSGASGTTSRSTAQHDPPPSTEQQQQHSRPSCGGSGGLSLRTTHRMIRCLELNPPRRGFQGEDVYFIDCLSNPPTMPGGGGRVATLEEARAFAAQNGEGGGVRDVAVDGAAVDGGIFLHYRRRAQQRGQRRGGGGDGGTSGSGSGGGSGTRASGDTSGNDGDSPLVPLGVHQPWLHAGVFGSTDVFMESMFRLCPAAAAVAPVAVRLLKVRVNDDPTFTTTTTTTTTTKTTQIGGEEVAEEVEEVEEWAGTVDQFCADYQVGGAACGGIRRRVKDQLLIARRARAAAFERVARRSAGGGEGGGDGDASASASGNSVASGVAGIGSEGGWTGLEVVLAVSIDPEYVMEVSVDGGAVESVSIDLRHPHVARDQVLSFCAEGPRDAGASGGARRGARRGGVHIPLVPCAVLREATVRLMVTNEWR